MGAERVRVYHSDLIGPRGEALRTLAMEYVRTYHGDFDLMLEVKHAVDVGLELGENKIKAVLNTALQELRPEYAELVAAINDLVGFEARLAHVPRRPRLQVVRESRSRVFTVKTSVRFKKRYLWSTFKTAQTYHLVSDAWCDWRPFIKRPYSFDFEEWERSGEQRIPTLSVRALCGKVINAPLVAGGDSAPWGRRFCPQCAAKEFANETARC